MYSSVFNCEQVAASKKDTGSEVLGNPYHKIQKIHVAFNWQFSEFCASMWQEFTGQHEPLVFFKDLLVSAKTWSSGIINFQRPRNWDFRFHSACVPWFKTWLPEIKSIWMRIECLCETNLHRFYLWKSCFQPKHACAMKPEVLISWSLAIDYSRAPCLGADQKTRGLWERDWLTVWLL